MNKNLQLDSCQDNVREQLKNRGSKTADIPFNHNKIEEVILPPFITKEGFDALRQCQTRSSDVFLVTYPKSGTFWLAHIVHNVAELKESPGQHNIGRTTPIFEFVTPQQLEEYFSPRYILTHLPYKMLPHGNLCEIKYIYLVRDPRDVAVSCFHFMRGLRPLEFEGTWDQFIELFIKGDVGYGSWFDHVLKWWEQKNNKKILFLKYENLKTDLKNQIKIIAEFLGFMLSDEKASKIAEECTFASMRSKPESTLEQYKWLLRADNNYMRKGIVGDWKNYFTKQQLEEIEKLYKSRLGNTDLERFLAFSL